MPVPVPVSMTVAMPVAMPVHFCHFLMLQNFFRVTDHEFIALADHCLRFRVLGDIADFFQRRVQFGVTLAVIFAMVEAMTVAVAMSVHVAVRRGIVSERDGRRDQSRSKYRRCQFVEFHFHSPLSTFIENLHPHTDEETVGKSKANRRQVNGGRNAYSGHAMTARNSANR